MKRLSRALLAGTAWVGLLITLQTPAQAQYRVRNLVTQGTGVHQDPKLVTPWGLGLESNGTFFVADEGAGVVTIYEANGRKIPFEITVPAAASQPPGTLGSPTGLVVNNTPDFVISKNGRSGPARLIVSTIDGTISGWNPYVDPYNAVIMVDYSTKPIPASYWGLATAHNKYGQMMLYASDSGLSPTSTNNEVDMFDSHFQFSGSFGDPQADPFTVLNVQHVAHKIFVTYAAFDRFVGGYVTTFDTEGHLLNSLAKNFATGPLQNPYSVVLAPEDFGEFGGKLLIGNQDDGVIHAYDPTTYEFLGVLKQDGNPIAVNTNGMWSMAFGGRTGKDRETSRLFFTAGDDFLRSSPAVGSFGFIAPAHHRYGHHDKDDGDDDHEN